MRSNTIGDDSWVNFSINSVTKHEVTGGLSDWLEISVNYINGSNLFGNDEKVSLNFCRTGDKGDLGPTGVIGPTGPAGKECIVDTESYGFRGLSCIEAPEVLFFDIIKTEAKNGRAKIDPIFIESCEPNSLSIISIQSNYPHTYGGYISNKELHFSSKDLAMNDESVVIMISGIRKGFGGRRLESRTKEQFNKNENFWRTLQK